MSLESGVEFVIQGLSPFSRSQCVNSIDPGYQGFPDSYRLWPRPVLLFLTTKVDCYTVSTPWLRTAHVVWGKDIDWEITAIAMDGMFVAMHCGLIWPLGIHRIFLHFLAQPWWKATQLPGTQGCAERLWNSLSRISSPGPCANCLVPHYGTRQSNKAGKLLTQVTWWNY